VKERIQKILANVGVASRRHVEQMVLDGRVSVNGKVIRTLPILIDPAKDHIKVDEEPIRLLKGRGQSAPGEESAPAGRRLYFLLYKPRGVYTTNVAQGVQVRAVDLLPKDLPGRVYPVGQLDAESKGLVLLTNDGELTNRLTHPRFGVAKTYRAIVDGSLSPAEMADLEKSVWIADPKMGIGFKTGRSHIKVIKRLGGRSVLDITIREGRNREIRRILAKLGHKVREFTRTMIGPLTLEGLKLGQFRELTSKEVRILRQVTAGDDEATGESARPRGRSPKPEGRRGTGGPPVILNQTRHGRAARTTQDQTPS
jgi:23S rRNA pseudouridine2605 synthase